jgi:DNA-binding response OmpR family regulator
MKATTIMIIDGDQATLDVVDFFLSERGHTVLRDHYHEQAIESGEMARAEVIVIDPLYDEGGCDYVRSLRSKGISAPILACTAIDDPMSAQQALDAGCTEVVSKPCNPQRLLERIEKILTEPKSPQHPIPTLGVGDNAEMRVTPLLPAAKTLR